MASTNREGTVWCNVCNKQFPSFIAFHNHKINSSLHICCEVCSQDFNNETAAAQHHDLLHSNEQNLRCPGCNKRFTRLGALIGHIELTTCKSLSKLDIESARKEKEQSNAAVQSAHSFKDYGRVGVPFSEEPHPLARTPGISSPAPPGTGRPGPAPVAAVAGSREPIFAGDDLLGGFDAVMNAPWGNETELLNRPIVTSYGFPPLNNKPPNIMDAQVVSYPNGNAWDKQRNLFPDAPPAIAPPPDVVADLQTKVEPGPEPNPFDPDSPAFNASTYYIPVLDKYKCPYRGCGKSMKNEPAFIGHLKSPAHRNEKLQCTLCLRYYDTATALTQHMESQGVRCKVRESNTYDTVVDEVTGGVALPFGKHQDNTVKYIVNREVLNSANGGVVEANKAATATKNENFNNFWAKNTPRW